MPGDSAAEASDTMLSAGSPPDLRRLVRLEYQSSEGSTDERSLARTSAPAAARSWWRACWARTRGTSWTCCCSLSCAATASALSTAKRARPLHVLLEAGYGNVMCNQVLQEI
jgi:hypothetical protein